MKKINFISKNRYITLSAIAIGLSLISMITFRGPISIISTVTIPIIMAVLLGSYSIGYFIIASSVFVFLTLVFFTSQGIFALIYTFMAMNIKFIIMDKRIFKNRLIEGLIYIVFTMILIYLGIMLTEIIFMIPLNSMMLNISKGYLVIYWLIILLEALLVYMSHSTLVRIIFKRLYCSH